MSVFKKFRNANADDIDYILRLESLPQSHFVHGNDRTTHTANLSDSSMHYFIAEDSAGQPLGFALLHGEADGGMEWRRIIIEATGGGVGRAFMVALLAHFDALGIPKIWLDVYTENTGPQKLYKTLGFHEVKRVPYDGEPKGTLVIMERKPLDA